MGSLPNVDALCAQMSEVTSVVDAVLGLIDSLIILPLSDALGNFTCPSV